jgi:hypothetical protein
MRRANFHRRIQGSFFLYYNAHWAIQAEQPEMPGTGSNSQSTNPIIFTLVFPV